MTGVFLTAGLAAAERRGMERSTRLQKSQRKGTKALVWKKKRDMKHGTTEPPLEFPPCISHMNKPLQMQRSWNSHKHGLLYAQGLTGSSILLLQQCKP